MQKMNIVAYQKAAQRTLAPLGAEKDKIHLTLGLVTEVGELADIFKRELAYGKPVDRVNLSEEIGDLLWYFVNLQTLEGNNINSLAVKSDKLEELKNKLREDSIGVLVDVKTLGSIASYLLSDALGHNSGFWDMMMQEVSISTFCQAILCLSTRYDLDIEEIMYKNIEKLKVRFPDKFTESDALNRDTATEREVLESEENPY